MRTIPREPSREDIGWLAGIVDGEGSIHCRWQEEKTPFFTYGFTIVNTNKEMLEKCYRITLELCKDLPVSDARVYPKDYGKLSTYARKHGFIQRKPCYQFNVHRLDWLQRIYTILLPNMTEKREAMQRFLSIASKHVKHQRYKIERRRNGLVETKRVTP